MLWQTRGTYNPVIPFGRDSRTTTTRVPEVTQHDTSYVTARCHRNVKALSAWVNGRCFRCAARCRPAMPKPCNSRIIQFPKILPVKPNLRLSRSARRVFSAHSRRWVVERLFPKTSCTDAAQLADFSAPFSRASGCSRKTCYRCDVYAKVDGAGGLCAESPP